MNYIDIIILILLGLAAINGLRKGLVEELAGLAALILGIWAAIHFSDLVAQFLIDKFNFQTRYLNIIAFSITFVGVIILVSIIGSLVNKLVSALQLGLLNRLAGFLFGAIKGALIISVLLVIFNKFDENVHLIPEEVKANSKMYEPVKNFAPSIFPSFNLWDEFDELFTKPEKEEGKA